MNYDNDNGMWGWQCDEYCLEDNTIIDISKCLLDGGQNEDLPCMFDDETTPIKACGELAYHVNINGNSGKESGQYKEASLQAKRRRTLQFESEDLDVPSCYEGVSSTFIRSEGTVDSVEEAISEMSKWVCGFSEGTSASSDDILDQSSEGWIAECFNDAEMQFNSVNINSSVASDVQIDIAELCGNPPEYEVNAVQEQPVRIGKDVIFKGRKSYMHPPAKLSSSVVYPFAFVKPCGVHGDVTIKDINQRIRDPPSKLKQIKEDPSVSYPTSVFSGKPVVGKTKIRTEGGKGSITIMRTKG